MTSTNVPIVRPAYVPPGYRLVAELAGPRANGFPDAGEDQSALSYWPTGREVPTFPLMIHAATASRGVLFATEQQPGTPVSVGTEGWHALYHDGMWAPGPGPEEQRVGEYVIHWQRGRVHSLTVTRGEWAYGVRGAPSEGVTLRELVAVAASLLV